MEEIWKPIPKWEALYEVSNLGRVKSLPRFRKTRFSYTSKEHILKPRVCGNQREYLAVALCKDGKREQVKIHRLVALVFIPNPNGYKEINHIDENKGNNRADNLEWCTRHYNVTYNGVGKRRMAWRRKKVSAFDENGKLIKQFDCIDDASCWAKVDASNVFRAVKYGRKSKGYYWKSIEK